MKDFRYLSYWTEYSCAGSLRKRMSHGACFSYVFNTVTDKSDVEYKVILYKGINFSKNNHVSNACLLSKEGIRRHLRLLKELYKFHYRVLDYKGNDRHKDYDRFIVYLRVKDVPSTFHKYILTWLRYTYEYPYNVILRDTYLLKSDPIFRFESISNLFNLVLGCYGEFVDNIHQIPGGRYVEFLKVSDLREKIQKVIYLGEIYQANKEVRDNVIIPECIGTYNTEDIEYWDEGFDVRKPIYMKAYKEIKK